MKDRDQKHKAIRYALSKGWLPQLEVDVYSTKSVGVKAAFLTDLDVLVSIPDDFLGYRTVVFDCKTKAKESPINRAMWLRGVLDRVKGQNGFCILKKSSIEFDHKIVASKLGIIMLSEDEFDVYATSMSKDFKSCHGHMCDMDLWDKLYTIQTRFPRLADSLTFVKSKYWMIDDPAEACRKVVASLQEVRPELDPSKPEHLALATEFAVIFARSLTFVVFSIFKSYLHPKQQIELEEALKILLYGGREAYEHRNQLYRFVKEQRADNLAPNDLSLPEWQKFVQLTRQLLEAPMSLVKSPLIIKEVGFSLMASSTSFEYAKYLCQQDKQAGRFAVLIISYLFKAGRLPRDFSDRIETPLLSLLA